MNIQVKIDEQEGEAAHDRDFALWALRQARLLEEGRFAQLDLANLVEEVEDLGKARKYELKNRLETLIEHLLKLQYGRISYPRRGWRKTILNSRHEIDALLEESPSLHRHFPEFYDRAWRVGQNRALLGFWDHEPDRYGEYEREIPESPTYSVDRALDVNFYPDPPNQDVDGSTE